MCPDPASLRNIISKKDRERGRETKREREGRVGRKGGRGREGGGGGEREKRALAGRVGKESWKRQIYALTVDPVVKHNHDRTE